MLLRSVPGSWLSAGLRHAGRWRPRLLLVAAALATLTIVTASVPDAPAHSVAGTSATLPSGAAPATGTAPTHPAAAASSPSLPASPSAPRPFVLLQMNLCHSGMERACFAGARSVDEAVAKIRRYPPDLVTLQEICHDDLYAPGGWGRLAQAMADLYGADHVAVDFVPAMERRSDEPITCTDGQPYGIAVMHHDTGREVHYGWYASQDPSEEMRAWTCTTVIPDRLTGCTTHLSTYPDVAVRQCHELMSILASSWVLPDVVVAGDFNLQYQPGKPHNVQDCVPPSYDRRTDNAVQQVFFTRDVSWVQGRYEHMVWTDHPLLYELFRVPGDRSG